MVTEVDQSTAQAPLSNDRIQCVLKFVHSEMQNLVKDNIEHQSTEFAKQAILDSIKGQVTKLVPNQQLDKDVKIDVKKAGDNTCSVDISYPSKPEYQHLTDALVACGLKPITFLSCDIGPFTRMIKVCGKDGHVYDAVRNVFVPCIVGSDGPDHSETSYRIDLTGRGISEGANAHLVEVDKEEYDRLVKIYNEFHNYKPDNLHQFLKK